MENLQSAHNLLLGQAMINKIIDELTPKELERLGDMFHELAILCIATAVKKVEPRLKNVTSLRLVRNERS
jgi:hypothetical protein